MELREQDYIFEKIINREIPSEIVYETSDVIAFVTIEKMAKEHILVVPKKHITDVNNIDTSNVEDKEIIANMFLAIQEITKKLGIDKTGYRVITNIGNDGGQEIRHLHFHILGGEKLNDKIN